VHRSTSGVRRACAVGTTIAIIGLTTGLGIVTATSASAVGIDTSQTQVTSDPTAPATDATTPATPETDPSTPSTQAPSGTGNDGATDTPTDSATQPAATPPTSDETDPTQETNPSQGPAPQALSPQTLSPQVRALAVPATVKGDVKVGVTLEASADDLEGPYAYAWSLDDGPTISTLTSFPITEDELGKTITVVITGSNGSAQATTDAVTQDVAYDGATSATAPRTIEVTAGDTIAESFTASVGSGDIEYSIGYTDPESADPTDPDDAPETYLPYESVFDPATATLSGTLTTSSVFDFTVVATNGTSTATEYVEVIVDPAAAVGVVAYAQDTSPTDFGSDGKASRFWLIDWDGAIVQFDQPADFEADPTITPGGKPTVQQGASLWVDGSPVDEFGNSTIDYDGDGDFPMATVTSDHATDQISTDPDSLSSKVTFPRASTHVLTVAEDGQSVSFPVTVVPTATTVATVATVTPTTATATGRLAYTGTDATGALPWALAMLAAGAGLVGLRALRRRTRR
jgi:hypothetical protein